MWQPYLDVISRPLLPGAARPRPLPHRRQNEQGVGRGARRQSPARWPRSGYEPLLKKIALVRAEAESRISPRTQQVPSARSAPLQPADGPGLPPQRRLSAVLGPTTRPRGPACSWISGADQTMRSRIEPMKKIAETLRAHRPLLINYFKAKKSVFQWGGRGAEQQSQSHHEKILWLSHVPRLGTRALSLTWQAPRARTYPRILLTSLRR